MGTIVEWNDLNYQGGDGVIIGSDAKSEWMLKWWWDNYSKHNAFPVTFFDFGMTASARNWCQAKGTVIPLNFPTDGISTKEEVPIALQKEWEETYPGDVWSSRKEWFYKPFMLLQSPYDRTLYLDTDCEVKKTLNHAFDFCTQGDGFSLLKLELDTATIYNSGVIVVKRYSSVPSKWAKVILKDNRRFLGDEAALLETIGVEKLTVTPLPLDLNFLGAWKTHSTMSILHHMGGQGKQTILKKIASHS